MTNRHRIVMLVGILDKSESPSRNRMMRHFQETFRETHPEADFEIAPCFFWPWNRATIASYAREVQEKYDDGIPTLFIGYTLGGIIAMDVADRMQHTQVRGVVTFCSPHRLAAWWKFQRTFTGPSLHVMGWRDIWIPPLLGLKGSHRISAGHWLDFVLSPRPARAIAELMRTHLV